MTKEALTFIPCYLYKFWQSASWPLPPPQPSSASVKDSWLLEGWDDICQPGDWSLQGDSSIWIIFRLLFFPLSLSFHKTSVCVCVWASGWPSVSLSKNKPPTVGGELQAGKCGCQMVPYGKRLPVILFANRPERSRRLFLLHRPRRSRRSFRKLPYLMKVLPSQRRPAACRRKWRMLTAFVTLWGYLPQIVTDRNGKNPWKQWQIVLRRRGECHRSRSFVFLRPVGACAAVIILWTSPRLAVLKEQMRCLGRERPAVQQS